MSRETIITIITHNNIFIYPCLLQGFSSGIPPVNIYENSLLGQDESSLASSKAGLTGAVIAVIPIKYLDEEYLFLCNIYNAVNRLHH